MSKKVFNEKEIRILEKNINIKSVSSKSITYTDMFKNNFIAESNKGIFPRKIFEDARFDVNIIGIKRIEQSADRWRRIYKSGRLLEDSRRINSGRTLKRELSIEEKNTRLEAKIKLLEAENELLKKAELIERGLIMKLKY